MARDGIVLRTETFTEMWSDAAEFHLAGRIEAYEGEKLFYSRKVSARVPRDHR